MSNINLLNYVYTQLENGLWIAEFNANIIEVNSDIVVPDFTLAAKELLKV